MGPEVPRRLKHQPWSERGAVVTGRRLRPPGGEQRFAGERSVQPYAIERLSRQGGLFGLHVSEAERQIGAVLERQHLGSERVHGADGVEDGRRFGQPVLTHQRYAEVESGVGRRIPAA